MPAYAHACFASKKREREGGRERERREVGEGGHNPKANPKAFLSICSFCNNCWQPQT